MATIANGKVYVGTQNSVGVFGILKQQPAPLSDGGYVLTDQVSKLGLHDPELSTTSAEPRLK